MSDHDPFNEPETAHPRARELMVGEFFWDCVDELAPFGSDEGSDAYYEWRSWRGENPGKPLTDCFSWICNSDLDGYNASLHTDGQIEKDLAEPDQAFLADHYDIFTLDATIIATALGQLMDEGTIDSDAKPFIYVAISRQLHPKLGGVGERYEMLTAIRKVVDVA